MATIRKRGSRWHAQVRRKGSPALSRSFTRKADAETWARQVEAEADRRGLPVGLKALDGLTVGDILKRYGSEITPHKKGAVREGMAIRVLLKHAIAKVPLSVLTVEKVAHHRDLRLKIVKPASVCRELALYQHAFKVARSVWGIPVPENPFALVVKPKVSDARSRRLEAGEWEKLQEACARSRNPHILDMVRFAVETAMRRSEVLRLRWQDIDTVKRVLHIHEAKNGHARTIPLTPGALMILKSRDGGGSTGHPSDAVFPTTEDAADSDGSRPPIPTRSRPAFRFDVGHHSEMKPATR
jgi:integrase